MSVVPPIHTTSADLRFPRPIDVPPPVSPTLIRSQYPPYFADDDDDGDALLDGTTAKPRRHKRRITPLQSALALLGGLCLIGFALSGSLGRFAFIGLPQHDTPIPQVFNANPSRYVVKRHNTTLPATLSRYHFASLGSWANGTIHIMSASPLDDVKDVTFEVMIEAPNPQILSLVKIDDQDAQKHGSVSIRFAGNSIAPKPEKWIKIHTRLILPRHHSFDTMELRFLSEAPYWWRQTIDNFEEARITFQKFSTLSMHGDIKIDSLEAMKADITTERGNIQHGKLHVPSINLHMEALHGSIIPASVS